MYKPVVNMSFILCTLLPGKGVPLPKISNAYLTVGGGLKFNYHEFGKPA